MEVCFDKDTLGHYFPTELVGLRLFEEASRKNDTSVKKKPDNNENAVCKCAPRLGTRPDQVRALSGCICEHETTKISEMFALQITASCTLQQGKHQRLWCKTCPTLSFHVASSINSLLYVCTLPLLSIAACDIVVVWSCFFFGGQVMPCPCCNQSVFYKQFFCAKISLGCFLFLVIRLFWLWLCLFCSAV